MTKTPWLAYAACGAVWASLALALVPGGLLLGRRTYLVIAFGSVPIGMVVGKLTQLMRWGGDRRLWVALVALCISVALFGVLVGLAMVGDLAVTLSLPIGHVALSAAVAVAVGSTGAVVYVAATGLVFVLWMLAYATCWTLDRLEGTSHGGGHA